MTYGEIYSELSQLETTLTPFGYTFGNNRLGQYKRDVAKLADPNVLGNLPGHFSVTEIRQLFFTLAEIYELKTIFTTLNLRFGSSLGKRLTTILSGPARAVDESEKNNSNHPRNVQFELFLMAQLMRVGFPLVDETLTDVRTCFKDRIVLIECKRPQRSSGIRAAIRYGVDQLVRQPRNNIPNALKIVAISLSKVLTEGDKLLGIADETKAKRFVSDAIQSEIDPHIQYFHQKAKTSVAGLLVYASASVIRTSTMSPATVMMQVFFDNQQLSPEDYAITEEWFSAYEDGALPLQK